MSHDAESNDALSPDIPSSMAEAMAEIRRLRAHVEYLEVQLSIANEFPDKAARDEELRRLRVRIMEYEARATELELRERIGSKVIADLAQIALTGSLAKPTGPGAGRDEPPAYTHNIPPSAPPHDE